MSFWTLLKHQVPDIHNKEELLSLPTPIIMAWWDKVWNKLRARGCGLARQPKNPEEVWSTYMESFMVPSDQVETNIVTELLRQAMQEYEE